MKITWLGTASLLLEADGERILFDPFLELRGGEHPGALEDFLREDTIFITHGHFDHLYFVPQILEEGDATVFCTAAPARTLEKYTEGPQNVVELRIGQRVSIGRVQLEALQGRHIDFDKRLVKYILNPRRLLRSWRNLPFLFWANHAFQERGETVTFHIKAEGKEILLFGSLNLNPDTVYPRDVDLLILPYQGSCQLEREAERFIEQLHPKRILLTHFDNAFPPLSRSVDTRPLRRMMKERYPEIQVVKPTYGKPITLS